MSGSPSPFNLKVIDNCMDCASRESGFVCRLPERAVRELNLIRQQALYPRGVVIFSQGEAPRGIHILCSGEVRLTASSPAGQAVTLRIAERGEVLGLSNAISREPHRVRAETLSACQIGFVPRLQFLQFLRSYPDAALHIAEHLSMELHKAWEQVQLVALAPSAHAKIARFLLAWAGTHSEEFQQGSTLALYMTHEEIANSIGVSRETVSRALADLREQEIIRFRRGHVVLLRPEELKSLASK